MRVNLSTKPNDIILTMVAELPSAEYFFRKSYGGRQKYTRYEDGLLDKALDEKRGVFSDINEHVSPSGNRWITYTHVEYYPRAEYANAFHFSFLYYETYASCGAFFPLYPQGKDGSQKKYKNGKTMPPDGVIIFTDHFFLRMAERTGKAYRSKELVREFICTKSTNALQADEDGDIIVKFKGGYGFGKEKSVSPHVIEVRTFLTDKQLSPSQRKKCEKIDAFADLIADGMHMKDIALRSVLNNPMTNEEAEKEMIRRFDNLKKLGCDRPMLLMSMFHLLFVRFVEDTLGISVTMEAGAVIFNETSDILAGFVRKYENYDDRTSTKEVRDAFYKDLLDAMVECARKTQLKSIDRKMVKAWLDTKF